MSRYSKAIAAVIGAIAEVAALGLLPDDVAKWVAVVVAFLTSLGVYAVSNTPDPVP